MSRYRIKTLLSAVWTVFDAEMEKYEGDTLRLEDRAKEILLRNCIVETLGNTALKGKKLVREVESLVQELVRMKRQHGGTNDTF